MADEIKTVKVIKNSLNIEGEWFTFWVDGTVDIKVKIRPLIFEIGKVIEGQHKRVKSSKIRGSKIIKKTATNFTTFSNSLVDYLVEDFQGIGSAPNKLLDITIENKIKVLKGIKGMTDFIMEKAEGLAVDRAKDVIEITYNG